MHEDSLFLITFLLDYVPVIMKGILEEECMGMSEELVHFILKNKHEQTMLH